MKKALSLILTIVMVLSIIPSNAMAAVAAWDGGVASTFDSGNGTDKNPYIIANGAQLAYLAKTVNAGTNYENKFFKLSADINLNNKQWTPIGAGVNAFCGTFDGNSKTISNLSVNDNTNGNLYSGLFGYLFQGCVKNVNVTLASVFGQNYVGGIVAYNRNC